MASTTWLITGASRGLGRALTLAAVEAGATVVAAVRGEHDLPEHERIIVQPLDVRDDAAARAAIERAVTETGRLDVVVNNAGYGLVGAIEEVDDDAARDILDTDLLGPLRLARAALPVMRAQGSGHIVQISTTGAVGTVPFLGLYNAAKWGLEGLSGALAAEAAPHGIRVTIVQPGGLDTAWGTSGMRFATPLPPYERQRIDLFGTAAVPWATEGTGGGTSPEDAAAEILAHVTDIADDRLRLLVGDDAPEQVRIALEQRIADYSKDSRFGPAPR